MQNDHVLRNAVLSFEDRWIFIPSGSSRIFVQVNMAMSLSKKISQVNIHDHPTEVTSDLLAFAKNRGYHDVVEDDSRDVKNMLDYWKFGNL